MTNFNINDVKVASQELLEGNNVFSVKFALQIAGCSSQQSLINNGRMAVALRKYVNHALPSREALVAEFKTLRVAILTNHIDSIYHAEYLENEGLLQPVTDAILSGSLNNNYVEQSFVRGYLLSLYHPVINDESGKTSGKGLGPKTVSFAMLLLMPTSLELAVLDRHHLARMNRKEKTLGYLPTYIKVEQEMIKERNGSDYAQESLGVYGWYQWEAWRQAKGVSESINGEVESHRALSPRDYNN